MYYYYTMMDKMKNRQILHNYNQIKLFVSSRVTNNDSISEFYQNELIETIMSHPLVIKLIKNDKADAEKHELKILTAISESQNWLKSLNYNFKELSLDSFQENYGYELAEPEVIEAEEQIEITLSDLSSFKLTEHNKNYLEQLCHELNPTQRNYILTNLGRNNEEINQRIELIKKLFPTVPKTIPDFADSLELNDDSIIELYKHILIGSINKFPPLFLQSKAEHKIALLLSYLREQVLEIDSNHFFSNYSIDDLYSYKLANCARYVNYSWNRIIQIVEPEKYLPWQIGKVSEGYWESFDNRTLAIKWLIEEYFNIKPKQIWQIVANKTLSRESFGKLGLSYLYNTYYNSLLKCIKEAYPDLEYWEIGIYPNGYWDDENAKSNGSRAFLWLLNQERIQDQNIVKAIELKWINRKLFSKYNLSTMFDYCFNKNLFELVDFTFPKQFKPWEIGNVKQSFWANSENHTQAVMYFLREIQQTEIDIERLLKEKSFKKSNFKKSKLANFFKNYYNNNPDKIFFRILKPLRIVREGNYRIYNKLKRLNKTNKEGRFFRFLKHGFNLHLVETFEKNKQKRIARKLRSRKYILEKED